MSSFKQNMANLRSANLCHPCSEKTTPLGNMTHLFLRSSVKTSRRVGSCYLGKSLDHFFPTFEFNPAKTNDPHALSLSDNLRSFPEASSLQSRPDKLNLKIALGTLQYGDIH